MNRFLLVVTWVLTTYGVFSQEGTAEDPEEKSEYSGFSLGVKGGYGHSFLFRDKEHVFNPSWSSGVTFRYFSCSQWGFTIDAMYTSGGFSPRSSENEARTQLSCLRIPVSVLVYFGNASLRLRPFLSAGPAPGILLNVKSRPDYRTADLGVTASVGVDLRLNRAHRLLLSADYYQGLSDIYIANSFYDRNGSIRFCAALLRLF